MFHFISDENHIPRSLLTESRIRVRYSKAPMSGL